MKALKELTITRLTNLEFGQHTKSIYTNITERENTKTTIKNTVLLKYLNDLNLKNQAYDRAMVQVAKNDETEKIFVADGLRDKDLICLQRYLSVFEFSSDESEVLIFASLSSLFSEYKEIQRWNYEEETNGIDNLLVDLQNEKYGPMTRTIGMTKYIDRLAKSNENFKRIFKSRTQEMSGKEVFNVRQLKKDVKTTYVKLVNYVLSMSLAMDTPEFNEALDVINTVRKYYSDLLAKRKSDAKKPETKTTPSAN